MLQDLRPACGANTLGGKAILVSDGDAMQRAAIDTAGQFPIESLGAGSRGVRRYRQERIERRIQAGDPLPARRPSTQRRRACVFGGQRSTGFEQGQWFNIQLKCCRAAGKEKVDLCAELTDDALERIARLNPALNGTVAVTEYRARAPGRFDRPAVHGLRATFSTRVFAPQRVEILVGRADDAEMVINRQAYLCARQDICVTESSTIPLRRGRHNPWNAGRIPGGSKQLPPSLLRSVVREQACANISIPFCGVIRLKPA